MRETTTIHAVQEIELLKTSKGDWNLGSVA